MTTYLRCAGLACCVAVALLTGVLGGCPPAPVPPTDKPTTEAQLVPFDSPDGLLRYFKDQASARHGGRMGIFPRLGGVLMVPFAAAADEGATTGGGAESSGPFSTTNLQESGVDESDVFKSDGTYFYIGKERTLRVVRASPRDELREVGRLDLAMHVDSLYLLGTSVLVLGADFGPDAPASPEMMSWPPYYVSATTRVAQVDIRDPAHPALAAEATLDGALISSRLTNDRLIVVLTIAPAVPDNPTALRIERMTLDDVMPKMHRSGTARELVPWEQWLHPMSPDGYYMTAVLTLDARDIGQTLHSVAVLAGAGTVYASREALYLTDTNYDAQNDYREQTAIHKFKFDEDGAARYVASGVVPGRLLNQFSLGEHQAYLRVATHVTNFEAFPIVGPGMGGMVAPGMGRGGFQENIPAAPYNAVYVLSEAEGKLGVVGLVEGLAPNEQIYAARFLADHGFLVTYRKVDPLFVLDLKDPTNPKLLGALKVPGFSEYLHPLGPTHLIGVGKYTVPTEQGFDWFQGLQISLFDVSDWNNPKVVQQLTLGGRGSQSDVSVTHKAFTFLPESNLLAIPAQLMTDAQQPWQVGQIVFDGVLCWKVDASAGFTELGRLDSVRAGGDWWPQWRRAAFIGDDIYALTADGVRAAPLSNFASANAVQLTD